MEVHLYFSCYRVEALIASQLRPEEFGTYMAVGTRELTSGHAMFFEVKRDRLDESFRLENIDRRCVAHPDGSPKRSLYLSIYRVLERIGLDALGRLYLVTRDGCTLGIEARPYEDDRDEVGPFLYQELCPVSPLVASSLAPEAFSKFITHPSHPISVPRIFFAEMRTDRDPTGKLASYLPYSHPAHIEDCLNLVREDAAKKTKTVDREHSMFFFYRTIRRGFFVGDQAGVRFYPFPSPEQLQGEYYYWWRSASMGL